jgi:hypothetical protein
MLPKRTFWEKATAVHVYCGNGEVGDRHSRQWHDLAQLDAAGYAKTALAQQEPQENRRLLNFVLSNSTWKRGELSVIFRQPFDLLAETTAIVSHGNGGSGLNSPGHPGWLGD